jgi:AraC-like DNA-binding protein
VDAALKHPVLRNLLPTEAGYFPKAARHRRERMTGGDQAIFIYCTKGRGWCNVDGRGHEVNPGELLVIPPDVPYAYGADDSRPWTISWVQALGANLGFFLAELGITAQSPVLSLGENPRLLALFHEVLEALGGAAFSARLLYASQALAHLLSAMIWRRCENGRSEPDVRQKIEQSVVYMQQHLDKPLQVATLAALANLSPSHYAKLFKRRIGRAPIDYFIRLRMQQARHLLADASLSVKEVAAALGYDDPFYFSRVFKSVNQVAPRDYPTLCKSRKGLGNDLQKTEDTACPLRIHPFHQDDFVGTSNHVIAEYRRTHPSKYSEAGGASGKKAHRAFSIMDRAL